MALTEAGLIGWAWCPSQPEQAVEVVVESAGVPLGHAVADRFDPAITAAHGQPGRPGFCVRLHQLPGATYPLTLSLRDQHARLLGGPFVVAEIAELMAITDPVAPEFEGSIDFFGEGVVDGWARNAALPDQPVAVELLDGGVPIARGRAARLRPDLLAAGKGSGCHGFRVDLPVDLLDGNTHRLAVRIAGSKFELPGGPVVFGRLAEGDPLTEITVLRSEVTRLRDVVDSLAAPGGQYFTLVLRTLSERLAALAEVQRESVERELDALRRLAFAGADAAGGR